MKKCFHRNVNLMPQKLTSLLALSFIITACTSNQYLVKPDGTDNFSPAKESVFVANKELTEQFSILEKSAIYNLVDSGETDKKLKLVSLGRHPTCGLPYLVTLYTLGLLPVSTETKHYFIYDLQQGDVTHTYVHDVTVKTRVSIWEWFAKPFTDSDEDLLAEGLSLSKRRLATGLDPI